MCEISLTGRPYKHPGSEPLLQSSLNQFRRKQNQRRLLASLASETRVAEKGEMEGKKEAKVEQHENNRFEIHLSVIFTPSSTIDRILNNVRELSACSVFLKR